MNDFVRVSLLWFLCWLLPLGGLCFAAYYFVTLPMRRKERARLFLDLIETALRGGGSLERAIVSISESRERSVGVRFHLLAAHVESGLSFAEALDKTPRLLPPQIAAILKTGGGAGLLARALPAARRTLADADSRTRGGMNYVMVLLVFVLPFTWICLPMLSTFVWPKLQQIIADMEIGVPPLSAQVFGHPWLAFGVQLCVFAMFAGASFFYIGGPRAFGWTQAVLGPVADWLLWQIPWRRDRSRRDFSAMLAILLEARVPEERAVELAAESAGNDEVTRRSVRVRVLLAEGVPLTEAVRAFDATGEFKWRLQNALHAGEGFTAALAGWHEALEAKAFRQEQTFAHLATSALVVLNGIFVGVLAAALFQVIISSIIEGTLW